MEVKQVTTETLAKFVAEILLRFQRSLIKELEDNHTMHIKVHWNVKRISNSDDVASECQDQTIVKLEAYKGKILILVYSLKHYISCYRVIFNYLMMIFYNIKFFIIKFSSYFLGYRMRRPSTSVKNIPPVTRKVPH